MRKLKWGILSTAKIAREKLIPAMQKGSFCEVVAIASRDKEQAGIAAKKSGIPIAHGSYEALLADPAVEAIYIPLPNHMHVEWAIKALEAGKHVLCEKPIALSAGEAEQLLKVAAEHPSLYIMEAFMYRFHPQCQLAKKWVMDGAIGELKTIQSFFSYYNVDPANIRNKPEAGGGGMMDIGCYCVSVSRFIFGKEPQRVSGVVDYDPQLKTDRMASALLDFSGGMASFTCSTQLTPYQRVNILGTTGRIELEIPFNAPVDQPTKIWLHTKTESRETILDTADQYTIQCDRFAEAVLNKLSVPTPLEDAINNMKVIEAVLASARDNEWKQL